MKNLTIDTNGHMTDKEAETHNYSTDKKLSNFGFNTVSYHTNNPYPYYTTDADEIKTRLEPYFDIVAPCIILSVITIVLNIFVINFYRTKKTSLVPLLYSMIAGADILTGLGVIHQSIAISLFTRDIISESTLDSNTVVCYTLTQLSYRSSVFYNLVLAVSRTVMILRPFHRINTKTVLLVCVLYPIPWIIIAGIDIYQIHVVMKQFTRGLYIEFVVMGSGLANMVPQDDDALPMAILFILLVLAFVIPVILITITCIIQVICLHRSNQFPASSNQRHVTITVIMMSTLFVICNSGLYGYLFSIVFGWIEDFETFVVFVSVFSTLLPILSSALNPVIIISRSRDLKRDFIGLVRGRRKSIRESRVFSNRVSVMTEQSRITETRIVD